MTRDNFSSCHIFKKRRKKRATAMALKCALEMRKNNEKVKRGKVTIINHLIIHCSYKYFKNTERLMIHVNLAAISSSFER
jgi:hypothetical protein